MTKTKTQKRFLKRNGIRKRIDKKLRKTTGKSVNTTFYDNQKNLRLSQGMDRHERKLFKTEMWKKVDTHTYKVIKADLSCPRQKFITSNGSINVVNQNLKNVSMSVIVDKIVNKDKLLMPFKHLAYC